MLISRVTLKKGSFAKAKKPFESSQSGQKELFLKFIKMRKKGKKPEK